MLDGIKRVIQNCQIKARYLKRSLDETGQKRLGKVIQDVGEMARSFMAGDKSPLKIQIMQKTLKLTEMYVKLIDDFSKRLRTSVSSEISNIANRINTNTSNLNNARDAGVAAEIRRVIESDERMIESLKGERKELEKLDARLQFMESTIGMLKYNLIYNLDSEDMLKKLETEIDEATAINFALSDLHEERRGKARSW
ncbi:MAG: hypothetical protein LBJ10_07975 [Clostridiales bacterium]|nr:hypothetical protein [Clostridiales bacterium]